jgi:hypothetical protein
MKRSVRNGIAIAGMAGGMWLLGQAVANAEEVNLGTDVGQTATSTDGGSATNDSDVRNDVDVDVENEAEGGDSNTGNEVVVINNNGENNPVVVAGSGGGGGGGSMGADLKNGSYEQHSEGGDVHASVAIDASVVNNVNVDSGNINNSSNASIGGDAASGPDVNISTNVEQNATSSGDDKHGDWWKHNNNGPTRATTATCATTSTSTSRTRPRPATATPATRSSS